ncbi:Isocitrate dehydrogenase [NADP], mitochondrial precursor (Oxalosuccinate decarboxylase), partial [Chytridiales sp. JEL 0842]
YACTDVHVTEPSTFDILLTPLDRTSPPRLHRVSSHVEPGVALGMYNHQNSIESFARSCFQLALDRKMPLYLSTKSTILKTYDGDFVDVFQKMHKTEFQHLGLQYEHRLIDDLAAHALKSTGGFVWACKNYDGDVMSDILAQGFGSMGLMKSLLVSPGGRTVVAEASHGTVSRHWRAYQRGERTSTNPIATIFAWMGGLRHRALLDGNDALNAFVREVERACVDIVEVEGVMTKDLAGLVYGEATRLKDHQYVGSEEFIDAVRRRLETYL